MKSFRATMMLPMFGVFAALGVLAGCSGQAATDANGTTNTAVTAQGKHGHGPGMMAHGPEMLLFASLHAPINLTDAQRTTIQGLVDGLQPKGAAPADKTALVAGIRAGKIDTASVAFNKPADADIALRRTALAKSLTTLHDTLTAEQRVALVAAIEKRAEGGPKGEDHKGEGLKGEKGEKGEHGKMHGGFGPMHLLKDLDLTEEQEKAVKAAFEANKPAPPTETDREAMKANHIAMKKEMDARLQTFASDKFDANAFVAPPANAPKDGPAMHGDHFIKTLAVIVPILTPAQREKLASKIEKGPAAK
jgi:Spy/CpxP family protein refolding chaperone